MHARTFHSATRRLGRTVRRGRTTTSSTKRARSVRGRESERALSVVIAQANGQLLSIDTSTAVLDASSGRTLFASTSVGRNPYFLTPHVTRARLRCRRLRLAFPISFARRADPPRRTCLPTPLPLPHPAIKTREFHKTENIVKSFQHAKETSGRLHLLGLVRPQPDTTVATRASVVESCQALTSAPHASARSLMVESTLTSTTSRPSLRLPRRSASPKSSSTSSATAVTPPLARPLAT